MVGTRRMSRAELDRETCSMRWRRITLFWLRRPWVFSSCLFAAMLGFGGLVLSELEYRVNLDQREATDRFVERMNATLSPSDFAELVDRLGVNLKQVEDDLALIASGGDLREKLRDVALGHHWDWVGASFFCFTAATTIGYGNYTPQTVAGKWFTTLYILFAIPICLNAYAKISDAMLKMVVRLVMRRSLEDARVRAERVFRMFDANSSGSLDPRELTNALRAMGYDVERGSSKDAERVRRLVERHDADGDGQLDIEEFVEMVHRVFVDSERRLEGLVTKGHLVLAAAGGCFIFVVGCSIFFGVGKADEGWSALDAFYFTIVTFTTVGFGDFSPDPHPAPFMLGYVFFVSLGLALTATLVRACADPDLDMRATLTNLCPRLVGAAASCWPCSERTPLVRTHDVNGSANASVNASAAASVSAAAAASVSGLPAHPDARVAAAAESKAAAAGGGAGGGAAVELPERKRCQSVGFPLRESQRKLPLEKTGASFNGQL